MMIKIKMRTSLLKRRARAGYLFIFPLIIGVVLFFIPNLIQTYSFSINDINITNEGFSLSSVGFQYYKTALTVDPNFIPYLTSTFRDLLTNVPVLLIFSLFIATLLNQKFRGRTLARAIFFVPVILSTGIIALVEKSSNIIGTVEVGRALQTGSALDYMQTFQIEGILTSINFSPILINIVVSAVEGIYSIVQSSGMQIFIFLAGLQEIPVSLYEAAKVEGCGQWELFWKITFPMISRQIAVCTIYTIVDTYTKQDSLLFGYLHNLAFGQNQYSLATAMYLIYFLCLAIMLGIVFFVLSRFIKHSG